MNDLTELRRRAATQASYGNYWAGKVIALLPLIENYQQILWRIFIASGQDTDRDQGPDAMIAGMGHFNFALAVLQAVERLVEDHDSALEEMNLVELKLAEERPFQEIEGRA